MEFPSTFFVLCIAILSSLNSLIFHKAAAAADYNVVDYGAVGDGFTDDYKAFADTWSAACNDGSGASTFIIPSGRKFLVSPITFQGVCASAITVEADGDLIAPPMDQWGSTTDDSAWITFSNIQGLIVTGKGEFDGQGPTWWPTVGGSRPRSFAFRSCNNLQLSGISSVNPPRAHLSINGCSEIDVSNLKLNAPADSPNTDGIDISQGQNNNIHDCDIQTGDDCIAIGGETSMLNITNVNCGPGHGISIGSLGQSGRPSTVEGVVVSQCTFTGTTNGARIKTFSGGSGYAKGIYFQDITLNGVSNPIIIDQDYHPGLNAAVNDVEVSGITYDGFQGTSSSDVAIVLNCSGSFGCNDLTLNNINITSSQDHKLSVTCINAHGTSSAVSPPVTCLSP